MSSLVLDAWAVMAWLKDQPAAVRLQVLLDEADSRKGRLFMNIVNLGEVLYLSAKARDLAYGERVLASLRSRVTIMSASDELVMSAAKLKSRYTISYADAFAAATAIIRELPLLTGDQALRAVATQEKKLQLEWIGA